MEKKYWRLPLKHKHTRSHAWHNLISRKHQICVDLPIRWRITRDKLIMRVAPWNPRIYRLRFILEILETNKTPSSPRETAQWPFHLLCWYSNGNSSPNQINSCSEGSCHDNHWSGCLKCLDGIYTGECMQVVQKQFEQRIFGAFQPSSPRPFRVVQILKFTSNEAA